MTVFSPLESRVSRLTKMVIWVKKWWKPLCLSGGYLFRFFWAFQTRLFFTSGAKKGQKTRFFRFLHFQYPPDTVFVTPSGVSPLFSILYAFTRVSAYPRICELNGLRFIAPENGPKMAKLGVKKWPIFGLSAKSCHKWLIFFIWRSKNEKISRSGNLREILVENWPPEMTHFGVQNGWFWGQNRRNRGQKSNFLKKCIFFDFFPLFFDSEVWGPARVFTESDLVFSF